MTGSGVVARFSVSRRVIKRVTLSIGVVAANFTARVGLSETIGSRPYQSINGSVQTQPLPRASLDGRVQTLTGNFKVSTQLADEFRVNASLSYSDRNNQTPQSVYEGVTTDSTPSLTSRVNFPYGFERSVASIDGALTLSPRLGLYAGCSYDYYRRTFQEVERTQLRRTHSGLDGSMSADDHHLGNARILQPANLAQRLQPVAVR